jgi:asparagine synthase (glutamine-hydrolysing)
VSALGGALLAGKARSRLPALLAGLADSLARRGPDGCSLARRAGAGMVYRPFHTTPESPGERQPVSVEGDLLVTLDGRLDRREELARRLGCGPLCEAELVARAYRRWGDEMPAHLVGDFALAVWDAGAQRLLLARDPFGTRPLFYTQAADGSLLWASNVASLRAVAGGDDALDEVWVAGYLAGAIVADRSPFRAVRALGPGHLLTAAPGGAVRSRPFWPSDIEEVRLAGDGEYEERFISLLTEAVACRLRSSGPVFAELSGGLDSSTIVCLSDRLLRDGGAPADALRTASFVFDEAASSDEREFISAVEAQVDRPAYRFSDRQAPLLGGGRAAFECPTTLSTFLPRQRLLDEAMRCAGARVLLSGIGGDDVTVSEVETPSYLATLALGGRFRVLGRELAAWQRELGKPLAVLVLQGLILPLLVGVLRARQRPEGRALPSWAGARLAQAADLDRRWRLREGTPERHLPPAIARRAAGLRATVAQQVSPRYVEAEALGREVRYPFLHRPLVELCLALPWEQLARSGETRVLHRRALAGLLPRAVAERRDKRGPDEAMMRALDREWPWLRETFGGDARIYQHGFVAREPFLAALEAARFGLQHAAGSVFQAIELELWLQSLEAGAERHATA